MLDCLFDIIFIDRYLAGPYNRAKYMGPTYGP
jgi:hypothetical protein